MSLPDLKQERQFLVIYRRGGTPSPMDRVLATRYGSAAADLIAERNFGKMVALRNNEIVSVPLADVSGKLKLVDPNDPLVIQARIWEPVLVTDTLPCTGYYLSINDKMKKLIFVRHGKAEDESS